jgi:hypothetical protein
MKRTPLKRKTPLRRGKPMRRVRKVKLIAPEDGARLEWLRRQPCCCPGADCGPSEVHHNTQNRAHGKKSEHDQGMPMAHKCHMDFHANAGVFKGWKREQLREWQTGQVQRWQALWEANAARSRT